MKLIAAAVLIAAACGAKAAEPMTERYHAYGDLILTHLASAPFPHPLRANGHTYNGKTYSAAEHYSDSSVAIFVPKGFRKSKHVDLVVYFHGWSNNIDTALGFYSLIEQFCASRKNAVFVFPEGPRNAPDSFGGRLEEKDGFKNLVTDVLGVLKREKKIPGNALPGRIVIGGHSGAYRVMSFILLRGGLVPHVKEVYLFDALYGQTEKFAYWIDHSRGRLVNIYTESGGTKGETENLMACLEAWKKPFYAAEELKAAPEDLRRHSLIFLHTDLVHNDVVSKRNQFETFLATGSLKSIRAK
ncbi:MAG: hypothetical protein ACM3Q4_13850 [Acidobacteriota bacterium]